MSATFAPEQLCQMVARFIDRFLADSDNKDLSPDLFEQQITNHLQSLFVTLPQETSRTLFSILSFHAVYPFSQQTQKSGVSEDAFIRAICLLTLSPFPFQGPTARATHSYYSGTWGPYHGRYIARRGRDASDFLRRVFRSLTLSSSTSRRSEQYTKQPGHMTMLQVPRFSYYEPTVTGEDHEGSEDEASKEIVVVEDERETDVDIIDVLSECPPEEDRRTANPFRESYRIVLPSLPRHEEDLMDLFVPTSRLVGLMQLLSGAQTSRTVDWAGAMESASIDGKMGWKEFEHTMAEHSGSLADRLSKVFGAFIVMKH
ncbi:hypothetical protein E8E12_002439 [Didymella heteroderae]|uniref:Uncharacterized protein n=1 Tax=Didymella heteroderae TaxID=1769908 RepID=A0A9P4WGN8_9PLEO|nr:hypothetical protein E8E12_002439 [Didymella heteroderae]